jgi:hypothetical protein
MAGIKISRKAFDEESSYVDAAANEYGNRYSYQPGVVATPSMTAEAWLCRLWAGNTMTRECKMARSTCWLTYLIENPRIGMCTIGTTPLKYATTWEEIPGSNGTM